MVVAAQTNAVDSNSTARANLVKYGHSPPSDTETNNISIINVNTYVDSCLDTTIIKPNIVLPCEPANTYFTSQTSDLQFLDHNVQSHQ